MPERPVIGAVQSNATLHAAQQQLASDLQELRVVMVRASLRMGQGLHSEVVQHFLYR